MYSLTPYPITPIGNFIGVVLALLPLFSNIRKLSLAVWGYAVWIAICDFTIFVNTIIWHDNVDVVVPVWCDIVTKLQLGSQVGTRACTLVNCIHLYKVTHMHGSIENTKKQKRKGLIFELSLMIGLPIIVMAFYIIVQPDRFDIIEEFGCESSAYSYVAYAIQYVPVLVSNVACLILASLTMRTFLRHHKEMNEFLSSGRDMTHNKYYRLMIIACLDTIFNLPVLIINLVTEIVAGKENPMNYPYVNWNNVHNNAGGLAPGLSLSSIVRMPASDWRTDKWSVFIVKWNEWICPPRLHVFHCLRHHPGNAVILSSRALVHPGYTREQPATKTKTVSDVACNSNPGQQGRGRLGAARLRGYLSFLETTIDSARTTRSGDASGMDATTTRFGIETVTIEEGSE